MTVKEYREKHRKCVYCRHSEIMVLGGGVYCFAKEKHNPFNRARKCPLYEVKEWSKCPIKN